MPRVSIITALYNHGSFIAEAIESVLAQTYGDWEHIVWDDGSTDDSLKIASKYAERDPRVKVFTHSSGPKNRGQENTRNAALEAASGDLVCLLDSDDLYDPRKLELLVPLFRDRKVGLAYGRHDHLLHDIKARVPSGILSEPEGKVFVALAEECFVGANATLFRRECVEHGLRFDPSFKTMGEYPLWLKIARDWNFAFVPAVVSIWRDHGANLGTKLAARAKAELVSFFERLSVDPDYAEYRADLERVLARRRYDLASVRYAGLELEQSRRTSLAALRTPHVEGRVQAKAALLFVVAALGRMPNRYLATVKQELWARRHPLRKAMRRAHAKAASAKKS